MVYCLGNGVHFSAEAVPPFYKQKDRHTVADDLHRKRSPVKNPECPSHVPHTSVPVPACKPGVSIRNRFQARNTEKTVKGYDIRRILFRFFPHKKKSCRTGKTGAAALFAGTCTGATGRTGGRNTLIYQRRQRSPSGTFQCRHRSGGGGSSAPAPYRAQWQCVHQPVRSL